MDQHVAQPLAEIPPGYMRNPYGHLVPVGSIKPSVLLQHETVVKMCGEALMVHQALATFREEMFDSVDAFMALLSQEYGAKPRSSGNTALESFDGLAKVEISTGHFLTFGPELDVAKSLIDECLTKWSEGSNENLKALVNDAFAVGDGGKLQVDRVLALRRVSIDDPVWKRAMDAIGDALKVSRSKRYIRFHTRPNVDAKWEQITLDMARV
jgi:hypothetical protein